MVESQVGPPVACRVMDNVRIRVLSDNYVARTHLLGEHGLSMLIEAGGYRMLFDCGASAIALDNARAMQVDLQHLDAVVLSHGHYDHTGGLADVLRECQPAAVFLHPAAAEAKYDRLSRTPHQSVGMPEASLAALRSGTHRVEWTRGATEVVPGVFCTGEIPRRPGNDQSVDDFFLDAALRTPDPLSDDQALFLATAQGLMLVTGCMHSGMANTVDHVCALAGASDVFAVAGGFHLMDSGPVEWQAAGDALARRRCQLLAPCHCTGMGAHAYLRNRFAGAVCDLGSGAVLKLSGAREG